MGNLLLSPSTNKEPLLTGLPWQPRPTHTRGSSLSTRRRVPPPRRRSTEAAPSPRRPPVVFNILVAVIAAVAAAIKPAVGAEGRRRQQREPHGRGRGRRGGGRSGISSHVVASQPKNPTIFADRQKPVMFLRPPCALEELNSCRLPTGEVACLGRWRGRPASPALGGTSSRRFDLWPPPPGAYGVSSSPIKRLSSSLACLHGTAPHGLTQATSLALSPQAVYQTVCVGPVHPHLSRLLCVAPSVRDAPFIARPSPPI